jgi:hypothetical protein
VRLAVACTFLFLGWLLIYSAIANGGQNAMSPWDSLKD